MGNLSSKELRIGNTVSEINIGEINVSLIDIEAIQRGDTNYKPIKLTEKRLLKFGFRYNKADKVFFLEIPVLKMEIHAVFFMKQYVIELHNHLMPIVTECNSEVHQLQNLYFSLTNKEL